MEYTRLGKSGLKISKIVLGCMSYGDDKWAGWVLNEAEALPLMKAAWDAGINSWDTADVYSNGRSEMIVKKAIETYKLPRTKLVILSKCNGLVTEEDPSVRIQQPPGTKDYVNQYGLSRKHIFDAVDASVRRLGTYIDVLQIHRNDKTVEPEEIMKALHDVVQSGKVRYIGGSSMYAHEFATLQFTATLNHWTTFISMQNYYNLSYREEEREMIPFAKKNGIGLIPWSPVNRGTLARPWDDRTSTRVSTDMMLKRLAERETQVDKEINQRVEKVAKDKEVTMAQVAIAWTLAKGTMPIVGLNSQKRIDEAVGALKVTFTEEETKYLEEAYQPKAIFGHT